MGRGPPMSKGAIMTLKVVKFLALAVLLVFSQPAFAGKRVALVIGNAAYQNAPLLSNPRNDSATMEQTFRRAGFDVVDARHDLSALQTRRALRDFADKASDADIAVIYYAGHGIEVDGTNYLIPVDAKLERDNDVFDEAFSLERVLVAVEPAKKLRLVILDACRDNPFAKTMKRTTASRAIGRGLAKVEPSDPNTLIAYSAKAGSTAADGDGSNSPFTLSLARHLTTPGLDVRRAFGFVRDDVLKATGNRQEPFVYGSLGGEDVPLVPADAPAASSSPASNPSADIRRDYELALQIGNKPAFSAFLALHPDGFYASLARLQLEKVAEKAAHLAAIEKAEQAEQERARLAAEGAQKDKQAKAEAVAKAVEQTPVAAERAKQAAQDQAADAERKRVAAAAEAAPPAAATSPPTPASDEPVNVAVRNGGPTEADLIKSVQTELRRVGCLSEPADGDWNGASQRSLSQFNKSAGTKLDVKFVDAETLQAIKQKTSRVCPLICEHGFKADGDHCTRLVCADGFVNDDNECEKLRGRQPVASRNDGDRRGQPRTDRAAGATSQYGAAFAKPEVRVKPKAAGSGQIFCDETSCRPVRPGCHIEYNANLATRVSAGLGESCR
jgi:Caspase domain